jgi:hypothetical protein
MLLASRNICQAWAYVNSLPLNNLKTAVEDGKKNYAGSELPGKTLGMYIVHYPFSFSKSCINATNWSMPSCGIAL